MNWLGIFYTWVPMGKGFTGSPPGVSKEEGGEGRRFCSFSFFDNNKCGAEGGQ